MLELTDYRLYENVAKLMADVDALREYIRLLEQRIEKLEEDKK
jgi:ubiquinone biosynthesis protein UbiJ